MFKKILIANRGEIARRVIRTARRLGIATVAVHSDVDAGMPFVREAGEAVCIGGAAARDSYLRRDRILEAAGRTGAEAIHPGYGFLSENADFAEAVTGAGLTWVGAPAASIRAMGLKDAAKTLMIEAGVPVTPGYLGLDQSEDTLRSEAARIGYPVLIKAVAGGGGKGMRRVDGKEGFAEALASCRREAAAFFGDDRVLLEKYIVAPRHIEVQIFGDQHGDVIHLFERDCSLQRRHQKVIEEAPAPGMSAAVREAVCEAAVKAARAVAYVGAGTIEFIADASDGLREDRIWFMEMNTRLQVEHPVTEAVTGQDLVEWQLRVAAGERLPLRQDQVRLSGWAMEARLYAEDPSTGFLPSTGKLERLRFPEGVRIDSGVEEGGEVSANYDPMIAKLIVHAGTRTAAALRLAEAAGDVEVWPVRTNAGFLARAAAHPAFLAGAVDTGFIERHADELVPADEPGPDVLLAAAHAMLPIGSSNPWDRMTGFRAGGQPERRLALEVRGRPYLVECNGAPSDVRTAQTKEGRVLFKAGEAWPFGPRRADRGAHEGLASDGTLRSMMPGRIVAVLATEGARVEKGAPLVVLEAMKMEQALLAPFAGVVADVKVDVGDQVPEGAPLVRIEEG